MDVTTKPEVEAQRECARRIAARNTAACAEINEAFAEVRRVGRGKAARSAR
jgi:hypothetical protein